MQGLYICISYDVPCVQVSIVWKPFQMILKTLFPFHTRKFPFRMDGHIYIIWSDETYQRIQTHISLPPVLFCPLVISYHPTILVCLLVRNKRVYCIYIQNTHSNSSPSPNILREHDNNLIICTNKLKSFTKPFNIIHIPKVPSPKLV